MATVYFRDDTEPVGSERVFIAENGWVAVTGEEQDPVMFPADRVDRIEGDDNEYSHTFDESRIALYHCEPHLSLGMKGSIVVD